MNATMETMTGGIRKRDNPRITSGIGVVPASTKLAPVPNVALATTFQLAQSPATDRLTPRTEVFSPPAMNGMNTAKATNGNTAANRVIAWRTE